MNRDGVVEASRIAAGERHDERHARRADGSDHHPIAPPQSCFRQPQTAQLIVLVRIGAGEVEHALRTMVEDRRQRALERAR